MSRLYLYLHTHWDREWYRPFESFRVDLVNLAKSVLNQLATGELPSFYLDGQAIVLDDIVTIDPGLRGPIKKMIADQKLAAGPWYVLPDQMLVCGESLIRNLKFGLATTRQYGEPALIGYAPDTFGHSQDLPRLLKGFNLREAVVWRGVPKLDSGPAFWWQSPDGSAVFTYHLSRGYYQSAFHENRSIAELSKEILDWLGYAPQKDALANPFCDLIDGALYPVGCDHLGPPASLMAKICSLSNHFNSTSKSSIEIESISLPVFLEQVAALAAHKKLQVIVGELRDNTYSRQHGNAFMLPSVLSARLYLKRENRLAEHRLINICERLYSLLHIQQVMPYPAQELAHGWKLLLQNHPHDSIGGCSIDDVHDEMQMRTKKLHQVLDVLDDRARLAIAGGQTNQLISTNDPDLAPNRLTVFNLSGKSLSGIAKVGWSSRSSFRLDALGSNIQPISRISRDELFAGPTIVPYYKKVDLNESWVWVDSVPGLGYAEVQWPPTDEVDNKNLVNVTENSIENEYISLVIGINGILTAESKDSNAPRRKYKLAHKLTDVGDGGDTYNFDELPDDREIVASLQNVKIGQRGPLVGSLILRYEIEIPVSLNVVNKKEPPNMVRSKRTKKHVIVTEVSLRRGSPIVMFETTWSNLSSGHRLQVVFETGSKVEHTYSENHFSLVKRSHTQNKPDISAVVPGCERQIDRFPCQRFFIANNQLFLNEGLPEYGVSDSKVAITLLRSVPILSRGRILSRGGGAGPHLPTPGANCFGLNRVGYGWAPLIPAMDSKENKDLREPNANFIAEAYRLADQFQGSFWTSLSRSDGEAGSKAFFALDNPAIHVCSLYVSEDRNSIFLRLLNVTMTQLNTDLALNFAYGKISRCRLDETPIEKLIPEPGTVRQSGGTSRLKLSFGPNELFTIKIDL